MPAQALKIAPPDPASPTILVVAPEVAVGLEITRALGSLGDRAHLLTGGVAVSREAIERIDPAVVFCHVDALRDGSVHEALLDADEAAASPHPVVVVTPRDRQADALAAINAGALASLTLPIDGRRTRRVLRRALQRRRAVLAAARHTSRPPHAPRTRSPEPTGADLYNRALDGLYMAWQPIFHGHSGRLWGYEALVRSEAACCPSAWHVLQLARVLGRTADLQERIRHSVARDLAAGGLTGVITVNLTVEDLLRSSLGTVADPLRRYAPGIVLEVTETGPIDSVDEVARAAERLRGFGYRIALDDLGAGSTPLSRLLALRPEVIKLDRLAISRCDLDARRQAYIRSAVAMAERDGATVVAEGVERAEEARTATALGCHLLQGYLLGRPQRRTWWQRRDPGSVTRSPSKADAA